MRNFSFILVFTILFVSCQSKKSEVDIESKELVVKYINDSLANCLDLLLSDWLTYYDIKVCGFQVKDTIQLDLHSLKKEAFVYFRKYSYDDGLYLPEVRDYSSNKRYHINLMEATNVHKEEDGTWSFSYIDEYQQIFLCDRKDSTLMLISYKKLYNFIDAVFWIDNSEFVLAGVNRYENSTKYFMELYNLTNETMITYNLPDSMIKDSKKYYMLDINMKSRGIIVK